MLPIYSVHGSMCCNRGWRATLELLAGTAGPFEARLVQAPPEATLLDPWRYWLPSSIGNACANVYH